MTRLLMAAVMLAFLGTAARADDDSVKLGLLLDMSSVYADITGPGSAMAARMAVEDFGGKVLGRPIELLVVDHQMKADIAAATASRWFDVEHVAAIMDVAATSPALAVMNAAKSRNKIVLLSGPGSSSITGEQCMKTAVLWVYNTYGLGRLVAQAMVPAGLKSWFFISADYTFGAQLEADTAARVEQLGGRTIGNVKAPLGTADFSAYLLQAQASGAQVVAFANSGDDLINSLKQASDFGLGKTQKLAAPLANVNDIHSVGLAATQGLYVGQSWYWDSNDQARDFAKRFFARLNKMPNMLQAGTYSATMNYLKAVKAAGTLDTDRVMATLRATPVNDMFAHDAHIRPDGLLEHDTYLYQVKTPAESKGDWDLLKLVQTVPAKDAFLPLAESKCPLVTK